MKPRACSRRRDGYINAVQVYPFTEGALYQVYTAPGQVTDIALQESEQLVGSGPVAAGDTVRWIIGDTESGMRSLAKSAYPRQTHAAGPHDQSRHQHRPADLSSRTEIDGENLYGLRLLAISAGPAHRAAAAECGGSSGCADRRAASISRVCGSATRIEGDDAPWRPVQAFDDGAKVYIEFPRGIAQGEMPPLFVIGPEGGAELVNYRARQNYYIVDRLFAAAELRLGGDKQQKVRIVRTDGRPR